MVQVLEPGTVQHKLHEAKSLYDRSKTILTDPNATAEQKAAVPQMLKDAESLRDEAKSLRSILDAAIDEEIKRVSGTQPNDDPSREPGAEARKGNDKFKNWGEFLYENWRASNPNIKASPDPRLTFFRDEQPSRGESKSGGPSSQKDMVENVGASGGYLVPTEFDMTLKAVLENESLARGRATVIPMRRRQLDMPVLDQTGTTAGYPHWFGGLRFYWEEEAGQKTESDAQFRRISLVANKLIGFTRASDELLDDSAVGLDAFLRSPLGFAGGAAWMEDYAFLRGTGAGQPLGVLQSGATIQVPRATAGTVTFADVVNMIEAFLPSGQGMWIASQRLMSDLVQMTGPAGNPSFLWLGAGGNLTVPSAIGKIPATLMGMPLIFSEKAPGPGYDGDLSLVDWKYYLIGDRQATTIESTKFERWQYDVTSWRMVHRVDGQPWLSAPIVYSDGETSVSPFVMLAGSDIT